MTDETRVQIDSDPTDEDISVLDTRLKEFNEQQSGRDDTNPVQLVVRDDVGTVVAGLKGMTAWDWLYVEILWVDESLRKTGIGSALLQSAESEARNRGCIGACLSTFSFQAPGFYQRHGYTAFGRLDDYPMGSTMFVMSKHFEDAQ